MTLEKDNGVPKTRLIRVSTPNHRMQLTWPAFWFLRGLRSLQPAQQLILGVWRRGRGIDR